MEDLYTIDQFAEKIKAQYPSYSEMDNRELTEKILAKYPVYKDQVDFEKKSPVEQVEPLESSVEEPSMDIPKESGLGESPSNLETYNNRIKEANMKFANTPVKEEAPTEEGFLDSYAANAQKRAGDRDSYRKLNTLIPGLGNTTAFIDQAYNSAVNVIPAAIKTSLSAFVNNDFSNLSQKVAKAKSEGKSEIEVNMWENSLFQSFDPRMINPLADAPKDRKVRERKEGDSTTSIIPLDEAESIVNELKKQVISTVVDVENANIESSKFQDPSAEYSDMFTPIGFMSNLGQMIPQVGVSVVAPYIGSYAQIYGDTYQSTVREIAAKKFRVELQDVTPKMMIDVIEKGEDEQAVSAMSSAAGAALDYIGVGKLTGAIKGPFAGLMRNSVKKGLQNGGKAGVAKALKKTGDILSTAAFEGVTEGGQSVIQQFGTGIALDKTISQSFNGINWDQVLEEGTAGALGGGPFGAMNSSRIKFNSNDVEAMIAEGDIGAIRQFTQEGFIDWRTIPNKTRSKIGFTQQEYEGNTYRYPNTILSPETPQTNEQTTTDPTGVPSMDEGSESNVNQIDEQDGLTAQEPTDIERRSKEPKTLKEADESIYDLYTVKDGDTEVEGSLSVDEGGKAEITTKDGKIYEVGNVNDNTSLEEAGVTFTKSGVEPLGNSQFNVDGKKVTLRSDHQFKLGKKGTTVTVYDENNKPIKLKGKQAEELEYFSALEKAENQLEETNQTLSEDEEFQNENITRPKETTKGETTVLPKQGTESDSEAERDVVDDLLSPVTEEDIEQEEKPVSQVQKEKSELIESKGGKLIDENTESEGILPSAIKATKSITSEDGTPTKFYVVETQEEFDSILDESGITDPEELKLAKKTNNAFYDPASQTVVYNKSKINDTTEIHEVIHPVLESYMVNNRDQVDKMAKEAISNDISLLEFIEPYEGSEKSLEAVVEGMARAAQADFDNKGSVRIKIKDFFDNLLDKAGFNRDVVIKGDETYVQLSRKLSDAFRRGRKIVVSNKAKSDGKIKNQKNQNRSKSSEYTKEQLAEIEELQENSDTTQRANTVKSYEKAAKNLSANEQPESVLDYGAGLGLGTDAMSEVLGIDVDSYEPNTRKWQGSKPVDYKKAEDIDKKYDSVVSLNVVNVVPKGMRDFIIKDIFDSLNEGGVALISSRPWSGDIATTKYFKEGPEEKSILVKGVKDGEVIDVYQKGFDKNELVDYAQELLGPNAKVTKDTSFGKMAIKITKVAESKELEGQDLVDAIEEGVSFPLGNPTKIKFQKGVKNKFSKTPAYLSYVTEADKIDFKALLKKISDEGSTVWFWMGDQLGRGNYYDSVINGQHYLDAGPSFALDPKNRNKKAFWASGLAKKTLEAQVAKADYIFIVSGSPEKSKLFNRRVLDLIAKRINNKSDFNSFKNALNKFPVETNDLKTINDALSEASSFEDLATSPKRKPFLIAIDKIGKNKTAPKGSLKELLGSYNIFIDYNELRDGFYRDNNYLQNDVMLVGKPTGVLEGSDHSTYQNVVLGEVVGVPDEKVDAWDIMPKELRDKYKVLVEGREAKTKPLQTKVIAAETGVVRTLKFQKSIPKSPSIAKVRDFVLDNEKILSEDVVYKSLKGEGVDEITVNQYRSIIKRLIDSTKKVNRKLQENGYKTKEAQREALKGDMNSYAEEIATLNDFLQSVAKIDRLKKVFQNLDTVRKFYKKGKLAEHWEKAGFLTNPNYVNPEKLSDNLFNKYSNLLNTLAKKLKRGTITYREIMAMDNFRLELYKENESLELDNIAGLIATKSGVNELASMSDIELEDFFERISKEEGSAFVFQQHHIDLFKNNKEKMLQLISEINNIDSTIDIENDEDRFSIPVGDRQRLWEVASEGVNEYRMAEMEGISLEEYVKDYLSENLMPADLVMLGEKVDNYTYIIKKGNYYNTRNDLFSELKSEIKRTDNKKSVGNIISDREKKYARTILSIDNQNDLLNFENYEIKHLINSVRAIREANWLPPVAATQNRKINGIRKSIILSEEFLNNNIESILNDVEKFIPSFETAIRDAVRKGVNAEGLKS